MKCMHWAKTPFPPPPPKMKFEHTRLLPPPTHPPTVLTNNQLYGLMMIPGVKSDMILH